MEAVQDCWPVVQLKFTPFAAKRVSSLYVPDAIPADTCPVIVIVFWDAELPTTLTNDPVSVKLPSFATGNGPAARMFPPESEPGGLHDSFI